MSPLAGPMVAAQSRCKCCDAQAELYGVVDFHKNCEVIRRKVLALAGIPIYYYRCPACAFIFTTAFDDFTKDDFHRWIYNDEYVLVDPDYKTLRPQANARFLSQVFASGKPQRMLDYGGGNGLLAELLRTNGFSDVITYDPFNPLFAVLPEDHFDCIVSFEVAEHSPDPVSTFAEMNKLLKNPGVIFFSTLVQPQNIDQIGLNWWYAGPRNGHVSLFSRVSLATVAQRFGLKFGSMNDNFHVLFREVPAFARHFIRTG